jgi:hypothetical protein
MNTVKYQLRLRGLQTPDGTVRVRVLTGVLDRLLSFAERGLRLAIEGQSVKRGTLPSWIAKSVDMTVTGIQTGSTILDIEAPMLGDTVGEQIRQQDFWVTPPSPSDTAFTLVVRSVNDATSEDLESEYYDGGVLESLRGMRSFVEGENQFLELRAIDRPQEQFSLGRQEIERVDRLQVRTPVSQAFIVSGVLNAIEHSRRKFQLVVDQGQIIPGRVNEEFMSAEDMRHLWGRKVSVKGVVHFKPSGHVRLLDAHLLKPMESGEEIFGALPQAQTEAAFVRDVASPQSQKDWLKDVWGQWPGDESMEELLADIEK